MAKNPPSGIRESILNVSAIYLFGRLVSDLLVVGENDPDDNVRPPRKGANNFLKDQLRNNTAGLARIYAFSFEGSLYELTRPSLFLVHGGGQDPDAPGPAGEDFKRLARSPGRISKTGLGRQSGSFSMDMKVWVYDKGDFSMRLDVETGTFEHILLAAELDEEAWSSGGRSSGGRSSGGRSSGGRSSGGRSSGVMGRSSGWMPRRGGDE
ncbi:hypothetical protein [Mesorhizobium sp. ZC-5]|jgi:uncharacterized membrane protein YgcG|uniref:hypothetical protein n=1 Tax=Mesorhizobium sp. ZC-5 TaxID=2986066 RepID=UPI0021E84056|nr:hypothetical protein [Mesorhizobium sp. ZC-5]MCV3242243.1 hypothetical protein [Mesorhizobium sp. ZC-5]